MLLADAIGERSTEELVIFRTLEGILLVVRFVAIIYFNYQAWNHFRYQGDKRDPYTIFTFFFLGLSLVFFFLNRLSQLIENLIVAIYQDDPVATLSIRTWLDNHETVIRTCRALFRAGFGYLFQNLAFLVNIQRWTVILSGGSTVILNKPLSQNIAPVVVERDDSMKHEHIQHKTTTLSTD